MLRYHRIMKLCGYLQIKWHYCLIVMKKIRKHINNTFKDQEVEKENNTQKMRVVGIKQPVPKWNRFKWKVVAKYATSTKYGMGI